MMLAKSEAGKRVNGGTSDWKLREEIEAISKALYLDKKASRGRGSVGGRLPDPRSKDRRDNEEQAQKDKKSIWNWKPLKAFSNRNRRFDCCFTLQVHNIENLPSSFEDQSLSVHWKRQGGVMVTRPAKVFRGLAEFEESLMHSCSVYGSRSGPHHSVKYEAKHFLLYAVISSAPEADLGKHRVDLTRLLPLTLEELEEDKNSGKWTTSFRLSGKGKGATLNVSFGYLVLGDDGKVLGEGRNRIRRTESLPNIVDPPRSRATSPVVEIVKDLHEVVPECKSYLACGVDILSQKFEEEEEEEKSYSNLDDKPELEVFTGEYESVKSTPSQPWVSVDGETGVGEFSVIEQGVEPSIDAQAASGEGVTKVANIYVLESHDVVVEVDATLDPVIVGGSESVAVLDGTSAGDAVAMGDSVAKEDELFGKEVLMRELESALQDVANLELDSPDSPEQQEGPAPTEVENDSTYSMRRKGRSLSYDDAIDSVASDFLNMLGMEHGLSAESEPESPRERLLRQFEEDALGSGCSLFDFGIGDKSSPYFGCDAGTRSIWENRSENFVPPPFIQVPEEEHRGLSSGTKAKSLEILETEALMCEWGWNENSFQSSPPGNSGPFGSPVHFPSVEPLELPSLGEASGPYLQTKNQRLP